MTHKITEKGMGRNEAQKGTERNETKTESPHVQETAYGLS